MNIGKSLFALTPTKDHQQLRSGLEQKPFMWNTPCPRKLESTASRKIRPSLVPDSNLASSHFVETTNSTGTLYIYCLIFRFGTQQPPVNLCKSPQVSEPNATERLNKLRRIICVQKRSNVMLKRSLVKLDQERLRLLGELCQMRTQKTLPPNSGVVIQASQVSLLMNSGVSSAYPICLDGVTDIPSLSKQKEEQQSSKQLGSFSHPICL